MQDFAFYNAGCSEQRGLDRLMVPIRRLLRRILRPFFYRQVEIFQQLTSGLEVQGLELAQCTENLARQVSLLEQQSGESKRRHAELDAFRKELDRHTQRQERLEAVHWDHVALIRRLAALEEHVEALLERAEHARVGLVYEPPGNEAKKR